MTGAIPVKSPCSQTESSIPALTWTEFENHYKKDPKQPIQRTWVQFVAPPPEGFNRKWYFASIFPNAETTKIINFFQWDERPSDSDLLCYRMKTITLDDEVREIQAPAIRILGSNPHQKVFQEVESRLSVSALVHLVLSYIPSFSLAAQTVEADPQQALTSTFTSISNFFARQDEDFKKRQPLPKNEAG